MADPSGVHFRKHRRTRRLCVMVGSILVVAIALVVLVLAVLRALPLAAAAAADGYRPNFELRDYLISNRPRFNRAEWIER